MAPRAGFEPATNRLTAGCSTTELPGNGALVGSPYINALSVAQHSGGAFVTSSSVLLVIGGARSGKSRYAEALAATSGHAVTYVATAGPPRDAEMADRIARHRADRPATWRTVEAPEDLVSPLEAAEGVVIVDCLTLWLSNLVLNERDVDAASSRFLDALSASRATVVAVTNEVGEGIVPATSLGRAFRDQQGMLNQRAARIADTVVKMVAGCPLIVKPSSNPEIQL